MEPKDIFKCRSIKRAQGFDEKAFAIFGTPQKADEALEGLEFTLARHPEHGKIAATQGSVTVYAIKTHGSALGPSIVLYYTVDPQFVHFQEIALAEEPDGDF